MNSPSASSYPAHPRIPGAAARALLGALLAASLLVAGIPAGAAPALTDTPLLPHHALLSTYGRLPLSFEPNVGQADPRVRFLVHGHGFTLFLTDDGAVLVPWQRQTRPAARALDRQPGRTAAARLPAPAALRLTPVGANPHPRLEGTGRLPGVVSYFIGGNPRHWYVGIPTYARVVYHDIFPGVDQVYYSRGGQLEYDFELRPGADPTAIRLAVAGGRLAGDATANLAIDTPAGELLQMVPRIYQQEPGGRMTVTGRYHIGTSGRVGLALGKDDRHRALVIDPLLNYASYLGGSGADGGKGIAVDQTGDAYLTGDTGSIDFPVTSGAARGRPNHKVDAFVAKLDPTGTRLLYAAYLGGTDDDHGAGITLDRAGDAYVAGDTQSADFPTTRGALQRKPGGKRDAFVARLNASGTALLYATYLGGSAVDGATSVTVDSTGTAYVTGYTTSSNFPHSPSAYQVRYRGAYGDAFVARLNSAGTALLYATYLGGRDDEGATGIALDGAGNAYVTGSTVSTDFPVTSGAPQRRRAGYYHVPDAFVAKLDPTGSRLLYATYLGGSDIDTGNAIAVDLAGDAYVTGSTTSTDFPLTPGALQGRFHDGYDDAFVAKLDPAGTELLYSTYLGGKGFDEGYGIAVDGAGAAFVAGFTGSTDFPVTPGAPQRKLDHVGDTFVANLNAAGSAVVYATYLGGMGRDNARAIALDRNGNAYVTGDTTSADFPVARGALQGMLRGESDAFVARVIIPTQVAASPTSSPTASPVPGTPAPVSPSTRWAVQSQSSLNPPVALNAGGSVALIGAAIYERPAAGWVLPAQQAALLPLTCPPASAAFSADGTTAVVQESSGAVDVFVRPSSGWHDVRAPVASFGGQLPSAGSYCPQVLSNAVTVAVSGDGGTAVAEAKGGAAVYQRGSAGWGGVTTPIARLTTGVTGRGVAISTDGTVALVGTSIFARGSGGWADSGTPTAMLALNTGGDISFESATLSGDGSTAVAADGFSQAVQVFVRGAAGWRGRVAPAATLDVTRSDEPQGTYALGLSNDGRVVLAASSNILHPSPELFLRPKGGWAAGGAPRVGLGIGGLGYTWAALSGDGTTGLVLDLGTIRLAGATYLFTAR